MSFKCASALLWLSVLMVGGCSDPGQGNAASGSGGPASGDARLTVDPSTRLQTIAGWEATAQAAQHDSAAFPAYRDQLFDQAVNDLGIDRLRIEVRSGIENSQDYWSALQAGRIDTATWQKVQYSTVNDNGDPFTLNDKGFWFSEVDDTMDNVVLPMKQRLEARGRHLFLNATYVAFTSQIGAGLHYDHRDPEEYAEFVQATYAHLQKKYGLVPDAWEIILEPDGSPEWSPPALRQAMIAAGKRLRAMGLTPQFIAPSTANMSSAISFADAIAREGMPPFWSTLSYHRYSGVSDVALPAIAARAQQWNLQTAMLEHLGGTYEELHADLKVGRVSAWQQFTLAFTGADNGGAYYLIDDRNPARPQITRASRTTLLRQYFRYIHGGATRIACTGSDPAFDPLAFINPDGTYVVVVKADKPGWLAFEGLPSGSYIATYTTTAKPDVEVQAGEMTLGAHDTLRISMPERGVLTLFGQ